MKGSTRVRAWLTALVLTGLMTGAAQAADTRIAILDFELKDLTGVNPIPADEVARTAAVAPLLRETLAKQGGYRIVPIAAGDQGRADAGFGYLFDHADEAAKLAGHVGADLVVVGRVHKPSFLFAYLKVHLVEVASGKLLGDFVVEVKGSAREVTERGTVVLARQIDESLRQRPTAAGK